MINEETLPKLVYCLCMDLVSSTASGLTMSTARLDSFNKALVEQVDPHLDELGLTEELLKFTGDGWLVMTPHPHKVPALCCLATIMSNRFQEEIATSTGRAIDRIPAVRIAICSGRDIPVKLRNGVTDWLGDSARRATLAAGLCHDNEILIDEPTRYNVHRDFDMTVLDVRQRLAEFPTKKAEEDFPLHVLGALKPEPATEPDAPQSFVYTLGTIGKFEQAAAAVDTLKPRSKQSVTYVHNTLLSTAPTYGDACSRPVELGRPA